MTNTINRAELTGIAAAFTIKYTQIATDSVCSLSQIRVRGKGYTAISASEGS
jgi:hypothetical protein